MLKIAFNLNWKPGRNKNAELYFYIDGLDFTPYTFKQRKDIAFAKDEYKTKICVIIITGTILPNV